MTPPAGEQRRRWTLPLAAALALAIGLLVLVAVLLVLALSWDAGRRNTLSLLQDKTVLQLDLIEQRVRLVLDPPQAQLTSLAAAATDPEPLVTPTEIRAGLAGALAAMPQVTVLAFWHERQGLVGVQRSGTRIVPAEGRWVQALGLASTTGTIAPQPAWGPVLFDSAASGALLDVRTPVPLRDGTVGVLAAEVSVQALSRALAEGVSGDLTPFLLYGGDRVLAHPRLADGALPGLSMLRPLPTLAQLGDPVLERLWTTPNRTGFDTRLFSPIGGHLIEAGGERFLMLYRELQLYPGLSLVVGAYVPADVAGMELRRLAVSGAAGIAVLLVGIGGAVVLGRLMARPLRRVGEQAVRVARLEFEGADLPGSVIRELNDQARAFNTMSASLRWFGTYLPRRLVERLLAKGEEQTIVSIVRELTVMFVDIAGFTAASETMTPEEVAVWLNAHFSRIGACIEAEDGTIDKFIGDALMAFWGAPDRQADHAARACRAALAIAAAVEADNAQRRRQGEQPLLLRIGIHTGTMLAGNVGTSGRMNYTIIGDAVNTCQRLERLAGELPAGAAADVTIAVSGATRTAAGDGFVVQPWGWHEVRGRSGQVEVFRLVGLAAQPEPAISSPASAR